MSLNSEFESRGQQLSKPESPVELPKYSGPIGRARFVAEYIGRIVYLSYRLVRTGEASMPTKLTK